MDIEELSHEDYLILMAKQALHENPLESKAWMITAKSLYTKNFAIQFEAYAIEKISNNCKDAAKHFSELFRQFQDNDKLWEEVNLMMTALCTNSPTDEQTFLKGVFTNIPLEIQYNLLLVAAERSTSVIQHCHLVLLLLKTFPEKLDQHCQKLIATLIKAEQHFYEQNPLNPFRKLFVCDLQPLIAASTIIKTPQLFKILTNCIDFYLVYIIKTSENQTQDILFTDCVIEDPWNSMFNVFKTIGRQLGWELYDLFTSSLGKKNIWQKISRYATHCYEKKSNYRQLVFSTMILFIHCLFDYNNSVESGTGGQRTDSENLVLLESISSDFQKSEYPAKKQRVENQEDNLLDTEMSVYISDRGSTISSVIDNFIMAMKCYKLLVTPGEINKEFVMLRQFLKLDLFMKGFMPDMALYEGLYLDTIGYLVDAPCDLRRNLRSACGHYFVGNHRIMYRDILSVINSIASMPSHTAGGTFATHNPKVPNKRCLLFIPLKKKPVLQYCCKLVMYALMNNFSNLDSDPEVVFGHILVLMQLDWPAEENLFKHIIKKIKSRGSFTYHRFMKYIINIDILEEFMYLSTEHGGAISLDILPPSSNQMMNHRRISTRGVDKGAKEDFKLAMRRQTSRTLEPIDALIIKFLRNEHDVMA